MFVKKKTNTGGLNFYLDQADTYGGSSWCYR